MSTETTSCPYCTEPLPDGTDPHFCPSCGEPLEAQDLAHTIATPALTKGRGMTIPMPGLDPLEAQDTTANPQIHRPATAASPLQEAARALKRTEPLLPATQVLTPLHPEGDFNIDISPTYADDLQAQDRVVASAPDRGALEVSHLQTQLFSSIEPPPQSPRTALVQPITASPTKPPTRPGPWLAFLAVALLLLLFLAAITFIYLLLHPPSAALMKHNASPPAPSPSLPPAPPRAPSMQHNAIVPSLSPLSSLSSPWTMTHTRERSEAILWLSSLPIIQVPAGQSTHALQALQTAFKTHQEGRGLIHISACEDELCIIWRRGRRTIELTRVQDHDPLVSLIRAQHLSEHLTDIMDLLVLHQRPTRRPALTNAQAVTTWLSSKGDLEQRLAALSPEERRELSFEWPDWPQK